MKKNILNFISVAGCLISVQAFAAVDCTDSVLQTRNKHILPGSGYWMQPFGKCRLTYTSNGGVNSQMYNLCENKIEPISNNIDAFPVPGGEDELYVHPSRGISFYKLKDIQSSPNPNSVLPFYTDYEMQGMYESLGLLDGSTPEHRKVRVLMVSGETTFRDYKIDKDGENYKIEPAGAIVKICQNVDSQGIRLPMQMPIISRDGQMISNRDYRTQETVVYKIDNATGNCTRINSAGVSTGKASFTFDNKSMLYVAMDPNTRKGRLIQMDIKSGVLKTLSGPDEDVQYMTAKPNGNILYSRKPAIPIEIPVAATDPAGSPGRSAYRDPYNSELVEVDAQKISDVAQPKTYEAIGMMWAKACSKNIDLDSALAVGKRIETKNCSDIVNAELVAALDEGHKDTVANLMTACSTQNNAPKKFKFFRTGH